jgi:phage tail sheath protein FI
VSLLNAPGVYRQEAVVRPRPRQVTGVPAFIGFAEPAPATVEPPAAGLVAAGLAAAPAWVGSSPQFAAIFGQPPGFLGEAVSGFFANGGDACLIAALRPTAQPGQALAAALTALEVVDAVDLICAPDIVWRQGASSSDPVSETDAQAMLALQTAVVDHCELLQDRFALLDSLPGQVAGDVGSAGVMSQRAARSSGMAALYYPWVRSMALTATPPCGHVAGLIARMDRDVGVHRAPANVPLRAAVALDMTVSPADLARLVDAGVNVLRAMPGRGVRIWGAHTLSAEPSGRQLTVRRLVIALRRWADQALAEHAFESDGPALRRRLRLAVEVRLEELFRDGSLAGATAAQAFYVKCDDETTSAHERELGIVVVEVGLAPTVPNEFVVVHIVRDASGVFTATGP